MAKTRRKQRNKFIGGSFQLRLAGSLVGLATLALLLQFLVLAARLATEAGKLEDVGGQLAVALPKMLLQVFGFTLVVLVPLIFCFAVLMTFRIAGPIYRFQEYLTAVVNGRETGPCRIRDEDKLQELCDLINRATEPARREQEQRQAQAEAQPPPAKAA